MHVVEGLLFTVQGKRSSQIVVQRIQGPSRFSSPGKDPPFLAR